MTIKTRAQRLAEYAAAIAIGAAIAAILFFGIQG